jgi:hypothetical protein
MQGHHIIPRFHRWDVVVLSPRKHGDVPGRCATATCALLLAASLFIDPQRLVGDDASLDLAMEEARRLF